MTIKSIGVLSLGKIMGAIYAVFGLIAGAILSLISLMGVAASATGDSGMMAGLFGIGAIIIIPIMYGILGFIAGIISALIYNVVARMTGGLEMEVEGMGASVVGGGYAAPPVQQ